MTNFEKEIILGHINDIEWFVERNLYAGVPINRLRDFIKTLKTED